MFKKQFLQKGPAAKEEYIGMVKNISVVHWTKEHIGIKVRLLEPEIWKEIRVWIEKDIVQ